MGEGGYYLRRPNPPGPLRPHTVHRGRRLGGGRRDAVEVAPAGGATPIDASRAAWVRSVSGPAAPIHRLTEREREVLRLIATGLSNSAIRKQLDLSPRTVEAHVRSIFMKLDLPDSSESHRRVLAVLAFLGSP